ncbi:unnamed protein product [Meganyctiphanes norvegica]|uniref:EF-hand domain-containing protein n=1 Tax=Meganyctiphanes norvegica TaxID=48144 RepID=A0AAV2QFA3_MEGNR
MDRLEREETRPKELNAAYLCVKPTVADDLDSMEDLKRALQYAGHNPTPSFLQKKWGEVSESMTYEKFCIIANELPEMNVDEVATLFMKIFGIPDGRVGENDFKNMLMSGNHNGDLSDADLEYILKEANVTENGLIDCNKLGRVIIQTVNEMKQLSLSKLEERSNLQRINSQTYTKKKQDKNKSESKSNSPKRDNKSKLDIGGWHETRLKGCFYLEKRNVISHQYSMEITEMGPTVVKIHSQSFSRIENNNVDILGYIFRENGDGLRNFIGFTDKFDSDGSYYWQDTLKEGHYLIIPYTSGCRLGERLKEPEDAMELVEKNEKVKLTKEFRKVLEEIFQQVDLDGNGRLNRQEFNLYNWRTSGEEVQDDEWEVVHHNFDVEDDELTLAGFLALHQLEAEDNGGEADDLWMSLEAMGYNRLGAQDQAAPFSLSVHSSVCEPTLFVSGLKSGGLLLDKAVVRSIMENSEAVKIKNMMDLIKYEYVGENRAGIVIQNKAHSKVTIKVDCSNSKNIVTNRPTLNWTVEVAGKSAIVAHQLIPDNENEEWSLSCIETLVK